MVSISSVTCCNYVAYDCSSRRACPWMNKQDKPTTQEGTQTPARSVGSRMLDVPRIILSLTKAHCPDPMKTVWTAVCPHTVPFCAPGHSLLQPV